MDVRNSPTSISYQVTRTQSLRKPKPFLFQALKCAPFGPVSLGIARPLNSGKEAEVRKKFVDRNNSDRKDDKEGTREKSSNPKSPNLKSPNGKENNSANSDSQVGSDINSACQTEASECYVIISSINAESLIILESIYFVLKTVLGSLFDCLQRNGVR